MISMLASCRGYNKPDNHLRERLLFRHIPCSTPVKREKIESNDDDEIKLEERVIIFLICKTTTFNKQMHQILCYQIESRNWKYVAQSLVQNQGATCLQSGYLYGHVVYSRIGRNNCL